VKKFPALYRKWKFLRLS